jgi:hypothetical protein
MTKPNFVLGQQTTSSHEFGEIVGSMRLGHGSSLSFVKIDRATDWKIMVNGASSLGF